MTLAPSARTDLPVLEHLAKSCEQNGQADLQTRLLAMQELIATDLAVFASDFDALQKRSGLVGSAAQHLLDLGGKRLRPTCVMLAARAGAGLTDAARLLAVAVELVHSATLLHDDVVDLGETRRGLPTARVVFGNAASIFAGDWLIVDAIRRVSQTGLPDVLQRLLATIEEMIFAESLQLTNRGRILTSQDEYEQIIEGKTASLFRWAMYAGGCAGGVDAAGAEALSRYGFHLGIAFQIIDDVLDVAGAPSSTGKALYADLREGKMTLPLILALQHRPALQQVLSELASHPEGQLPPEALRHQVHAALVASGSIEACRAYAQRHIDSALKALAPLPTSAAKAALVTVAEAAIHRER